MAQPVDAEEGEGDVEFTFFPAQGVSIPDPFHAHSTFKFGQKKTGLKGTSKYSV